MATITKRIVADIQRRDIDGLHHFFSDELPGFHLCGSNLGALKRAIPAAVKHFFKHKFDVDVSVSLAEPTTALGIKPPAKKAAPGLRPPERVVMERDLVCA